MYKIQTTNIFLLQVKNKVFQILVIRRTFQHHNHSDIESHGYWYTYTDENRISMVMRFAYANDILNTLQWHQYGCDGVSNHQPHHCLLNVYSDADQRKHQSSASLAFVRGIHRWPHKRPITRNMFPFDDVIMIMSYTHHPARLSHGELYLRETPNP